MHLRSLLALSPIVAGSICPLSGEERSVRLSRIAAVGSLCPCPHREAQQCSEVVDHRLKDPGGYPPPCLLVDGLPRRKIVGHSIHQEAPARTNHLKALKTSLRSWVRWGASSRTSSVKYGATKAHSWSETS